MWSLHGMGEQKFDQMVYITWPKLAAIPIYSKNQKNHLLWNQKADDHENWFAALGTQVLPS